MSIEVPLYYVSVHACAFVYEYAFSCSGVEDDPFCLCHGFPRMLVPCSNQSIDEAGIYNDLLTVERVDESEKVASQIFTFCSRSKFLLG